MAVSIFTQNVNLQQAFLKQKNDDTHFPCVCNRWSQGLIQPVSSGGAISIIFGSQVSLQVHCCKRHEVFFKTLL